MHVYKSESHQKKKPTRQAKRKRTLVGDDDVHLIIDRTNDPPIPVVTTGDTDDRLIMVSPERGTRPLPERLFDDTASPFISPSLLFPVQPHVQPANNILMKFKKSATLKSSPILDDKCLFTLLRSSFVQTSIGALKSGDRKQIHIGNTRRAAK